MASLRHFVLQLILAIACNAILRLVVERRVRANTSYMDMKWSGKPFYFLVFAPPIHEIIAKAMKTCDYP